MENNRVQGHSSIIIIASRHSATRLVLEFYSCLCKHVSLCFVGSLIYQHGWKTQAASPENIVLNLKCTDFAKRSGMLPL